MSTYTPNYNLNKPDYSDDADVGDINGNMDIIDSAMSENASNISDLQSGKQNVTDNSLLTTSKQVVGAINEVKNGVANLSDRFDYSTTEKAIGKWIDGKTLYEKTYVFGINDLVGGTISDQLISGSFYLTGVRNFDTVWLQHGFLLNPQGLVGFGPYYTPIGFVSWDDKHLSSNIQKAGANDDFRVTWDQTYATVLYQYRNQLKFVFVFRYTKT